MNIAESGSVLRLGRAGGSTRPETSVPVAVSVDGVPGRLRLRVTEDASGYTVLAEFQGISADAFEVELVEREVCIVVRRRLPGRSLQAFPVASVAAPGHGHVVLVFGQAIDAAASIGECGDGLLRLSLRKAGSGLNGRTGGGSSAAPTSPH